MSSLPPFGMASLALMARLTSAVSSWDRVGHHRPQPAIERAVELDILAQRAREADWRCRRPAAFISVDTGSQGLAPGEGQQPAGSARRTLARPVAGLRRTSSAAAVVVQELSRSSVEVADDDAEKIVEIVRHAAGQLPIASIFCACRSVASAISRLAASSFERFFTNRAWELLATEDSADAPANPKRMRKSKIVRASRSASPGRPEALSRFQRIRQGPTGSDP